MTHTLANPIPAVVNDGVVCHAVESSGSHVVWRDGSSVVHAFGCFGGGEGGTPWWAHYTNLGTGAHSLVQGGVGATWNFAYSPTYNKLYCMAHYVPYTGSVWEFNPATGALTTLIDKTACDGQSIAIGADHKIYFMDALCHVWSYDPAVGMPGGLKDYGRPWEIYMEYGGLAAPNGYVYIWARDSETGTVRYYSCPTAGDVDWNQAGFTDTADASLRALANMTWFMRRTGGQWYALTGGAWNATSDPGSDTGNLPHYPTYVYEFGDDEELVSFVHDYLGYDINNGYLVPVKAVWEKSQFRYKAVAEEEYTVSELNFPTEGFIATPTRLATPKTGSNAFLVGDGYGVMLDFLYTGGGTPSYKGPSLFSPGGILPLPGGDILICGYANIMMRYNPAAAWTFGVNSTTPVAPGDAGWNTRSNPYFVRFSDVAIWHRLFCMDYDANGVAYVGGYNIRNELHGGVFWYNPADGSRGSLFPSWQSEPYKRTRHLCAANNRSLICVSDDVGNIWIVTAATKSVDPTPIVPVQGEASKTWMVETSTNVVIGITIDESGDWRLIKFNPSTKSISYNQPWPIANTTPFGWGYGSDPSRTYIAPVLGPDGQVWIFADDDLYRIDPSDMSTDLIKAAAGFGRLTFANNSQDLLIYGDGVDVKYIPGLFESDEEPPPASVRSSVRVAGRMS